MGSRERQEDAFAVLDSTDPAMHEHTEVLAIVADGMGGMAHGDAASHTATAAFLKAWKPGEAGNLIPQALHEALHTANADVCATARSLGCLGEMGCTLVAASIRTGAMHWIAVGDSDLLLVRDGSITTLNTPHTYAEELESRAMRGELSENAALSDNQRTALTSFLGLDPLPFTDRTFHPFPLRPGDCVLIASDGLRNAVAEDDIVAIHHDWLGAGNGQPQDLAERLITAVQNKALPGQDNTTVIAVTISTPTPEATATPSRNDALERDPLHVERAEGDIRASVPILATVWRPSASSETRRSHLRLSILARLLAIVVGAGLIFLGIYFAPHRGDVPEAPSDSESKTNVASDSAISAGSPSVVIPEAGRPGGGNVEQEGGGRERTPGAQRPSPLSPAPEAAIPAKSELPPGRKERK